MPSKDPVQSLQDILTNIDRIERFTAGMDYFAYSKDEKTVFAVERAMLNISEAAHQMSD